MTPLSWVALAVAAAAAVSDWWAVARADTRVEYVAKPLATFALLVLAASIAVEEHHGPQPFFVAALALSLVGDVFLMLPDDHFVPGLASFLLAHVAYIVGFVVTGPHGVGLLVGLVLVAVVVGLLARRILAALRATGQRELLVPVTAYMAVIAVMTVLATGAGPALAVAGAWLFLTSDALLAWNRFVQPRPWGPVAVIVTYHLAQAGLALSLT